MIPELSRWQSAALQSAASMQVDLPAINEAVGIIENVFGASWLTKACEANRGHPLPFRRHPIGNFLVPPGEDQIAALLELVEYLKFAATSPEFSTLVYGLKNQYGPTFLQLAFAYRFARAGAEEVGFEPVVSGGLRGDIAFRIGDRPIIAECFIPRLKPQSIEANWLLTQCLELRHGNRTCVLSINVKLKKTPSAIERKQIVRIVREFAAAFEASIVADDSLGNARYSETEAAHISVAQTVSVGPGQHSVGRRHPQFPDVGDREPSIFGRIAVASASDFEQGRIPPEGNPTLDHVAIWLSDNDEEAQSLNKDLDEPLLFLGNKLERKLAQASRDPATGRMLVVSSWLTAQLRRASVASLERLKYRLFQKHTGVVGLLMSAHTYNPVRRRYAYQITPLLPDGGERLFNAFLEEILRLEKSQSIPMLAR